MTLSDVDIKKYLKKGIMSIKPIKESQIGPASVDLTLSDNWYFFNKKYIGKKVDLSKIDFRAAFKKKKADKVELAPGELCLGKTLEKIRLPNNIIGKLEGRSKYARMGIIIHTTSALIHPGSNNHQILEIVNLAPFTITIHKGMRISQVLFDELRSPTSKPYAKFGKIARRQ
jgi:dCTP deaminase